MTDPEDRNTQVSISPLAWLAAAVLLIMAGVTALLAIAFPALPDRSQFGDSFGGVNALFSGLAFAGLIFAVHLQRQELALQRKELELTRTELKRTAAAQEASEKALAKQANALEMAAQLNALSSVIQHYQLKIDFTTAASQKLEQQRAQLEYLSRLEVLLATIRPT